MFTFAVQAIKKHNKIFIRIRLSNARIVDIETHSILAEWVIHHTLNSIVMIPPFPIKEHCYRKTGFNIIFCEKSFK